MKIRPHVGTAACRANELGLEIRQVNIIVGHRSALIAM
jgi:hypothetical protein